MFHAPEVTVKTDETQGGLSVAAAFSEVAKAAVNQCLWREINLQSAMDCCGFLLSLSLCC